MTGPIEFVHPLQQCDTHRWTTTVDDETFCPECGVRAAQEAEVASGEWDSVEKRKEASEYYE